MTGEMTAQPTRPAAGSETTLPEPADAPVLSAPADPATAGRPGLRARLGNPPPGPLWLGFGASVLLLVGGTGGGGTLIHDPILTNSALGFWRYGHGRELATALMYLGVVLMAWAWVKLGREVLARRVGGRAVLSTAVLWMLPMLVSPPLFTRDPYSYLAQGALPLFGFDPYAVGPEAMPGVFTDNVHYFWQDTPAPYGPLFILVAKAWAWVTIQLGSNMIVGIIGTRLIMCIGLALLIWTMPELTRRLGGRPSVALWVVIANPVMVIHLVGGAHNDLLLVGLLSVGCLAALNRRHVLAIALVTLAMATKASAGVALPFIVLIWVGHLEGPWFRRLVRAGAAGVAVFLAVFTACSLAAQVGLGWLPALSAPSMIVNWLSIPTGLAQLLHTALAGVVTSSPQPYINVLRVIGGIVMVAIIAWNWWKAREGGPDAVRRAGIALLAVALLSPATLPWYLSWGLAILAMVPWSARGLQWLVFGSLFLMVAYYPSGETALYNWPFLIVCALLAALAARSLLRPDPLGLSRTARRKPVPARAA
ncbi:polyprenol phosphomannose-dependent alpha 1,6 mannosyltransferase MptB [Pseudonocardia sp. WMMC193]|uniref:polyprenol phosphomannose-dependent alpha 1,6 mannosyltransferase MptB n=1 Tax=Pseudonocardia sp. WMMC193 TaxID=2911965 RepID=UPI001F44E6A1|nr:polyprenol phosphomannose-dependent alpha 1,6 mannosyltransferase MptB [Pseudonocardia sp. WMMC193]MCF7548336.1 polyprenol phosphomannose-dependent alpha 1,6 mannosyltransferase MptB [Pseudonocardia sp. WMMC193]